LFQYVLYSTSQLDSGPHVVVAPSALAQAAALLGNALLI
jgi:hypothetical protein